MDNAAWKEANDGLDAGIKTVHEIGSSLRVGTSARQQEVDEILATTRHDILTMETNLMDATAKITSEKDQAVYSLNARIDFTNKELAAMQESLHTTHRDLKEAIDWWYATLDA